MTVGERQLLKKYCYPVHAKIGTACRKDKLEEQSVDHEWMLSLMAVYDEREVTLEKDMVYASRTVEQEASFCKSMLTDTPVHHVDWLGSAHTNTCQ